MDCQAIPRNSIPVTRQVKAEGAWSHPSESILAALRPVPAPVERVLAEEGTTEASHSKQEIKRALAAECA